MKQYTGYIWISFIRMDRKSSKDTEFVYPTYWITQNGDSPLVPVHDLSALCHMFVHPDSSHIR